MIDIREAFGDEGSYRRVAVGHLFGLRREVCVVLTEERRDATAHGLIGTFGDIFFDIIGFGTVEIGGKVQRHRVELRQERHQLLDESVTLGSLLQERGIADADCSEL